MLGIVAMTDGVLLSIACGVWIGAVLVGWTCGAVCILEAVLAEVRKR